jgi:hypothetical protein
MQRYFRQQFNKDSGPSGDSAPKHKRSAADHRKKFHRFYSPSNTSLDTLVQKHEESPDGEAVPRDDRKAVLQEEIDKKFNNMVITHIHDITGFAGEMTRDRYPQKDGATPRKALSDNLDQALRNYNVENAKSKKGFFKINPDLLSDLGDYLRKEPEKFSVSPEDYSRKTDKDSLIACFDHKRPSDSFGDFFDPKQAIDRFKEVESTKKAKYLYEHVLSLINNEPFTLEMHTADVLRRFERCIASRWGRDDQPDLHEMRALLIGHDFGKPLISESLQEQLAITPLATELFEKTLPNAAGRILSIYKINIGELHKQVAGKWGERGKTSEQVAEELARQIIKTADDFKVSPTAIANIAEAYFKCDAGAYPSMIQYFPVEYDTKSDSWKMTFDDMRQKAHNLLFEKLGVLMQKQAMEEAETIRNTTKGPSRMSKPTFLRDHPRTDKRVGDQIDRLKQTAKEFGKQTDQYDHILPTELYLKFRETCYAKFRQFRNSLDGATYRYGEKNSGRARPQRHLAEKHLEDMNSILENMNADLEAWKQFMNAPDQPGMDQQKREDVLNTAKESYAKVLDGYQNDQVEPTDREKFRQLLRQASEKDNSA